MFQELLDLQIKEAEFEQEERKFENKQNVRNLLTAGLRIASSANNSLQHYIVDALRIVDDEIRELELSLSRRDPTWRPRS